MSPESQMSRSTGGTNLAEVLERVLDKGIVITGDIKIFITNVELLTLQIRLVVCSIDKAKEMGMDWWTAIPAFSPKAQEALPAHAIEKVEERLERLEEAISAKPRSRMSS